MLLSDIQFSINEVLRFNPEEIEKIRDRSIASHAWKYGDLYIIPIKGIIKNKQERDDPKSLSKALINFSNKSNIPYNKVVVYEKIRNNYVFFFYIDDVDIEVTFDQTLGNERFDESNRPVYEIAFFAYGTEIGDINKGMQFQTLANVGKIVDWFVSQKPDAIFMFSGSEGGYDHFSGINRRNRIYIQMIQKASHHNLFIYEFNDVYGNDNIYAFSKNPIFSSNFKEIDSSSLSSKKKVPKEIGKKAYQKYQKGEVVWS